MGMELPATDTTVRKTMKKIYLPLLILMYTSIVQAHLAYTGQSAQVTQPGQGCTVFYAASSDLAIAGNNEDSFSPLTGAWFIPASDGRYGRVYFGYDDLSPQGGLNDQGLFFDGLRLSGEPELLQLSGGAERVHL